MNAFEIQKKIDLIHDSTEPLWFSVTQNSDILAVEFGSTGYLIRFFTEHFDTLKRHKLRTKVVGTIMLVWEQK